MSIEAELQALEQELLQTSVRKDAARVAALLAENFREFGTSGRVFTKAEIIAALLEEVPAILSMQDMQCVQLAENIALVTYRTRKVQAGAPA